jgi:hypothetical protein
MKISAGSPSSIFSIKPKEDLKLIEIIVFFSLEYFLTILTRGIARFDSAKIVKFFDSSP